MTSPSSSTPSNDSNSHQTQLTFNWTVPSDSILNCLYDDNDIYTEYDDYQDDFKIESPAFGLDTGPQQQQAFVLKLYPRSTEGCSDCGSLVLQLKASVKDELRIDCFKVSISSYSGQVEKSMEGERTLFYFLIFMYFIVFQESADVLLYYHKV